MVSRSAARSNILESGTGNHRHGSIMQGKLGGDGAGNATENIQIYSLQGYQ